MNLHLVAWLSLPRAGEAEIGYSRFGRGRGNGTAVRSTTVLCMYWVVESRPRNAAIESLARVLRTAGDLGMEPGSNSLAGTCFAPLLLTFRSANMLNTTTTATTMLSRV